MLISNKTTTMFDSLRDSIRNSDEIIMNVSFIRDSGLKLLIPYLLEASNRGKIIKILTSDYMKVTEPTALYRLLEINGVRIFSNLQNVSFHPKTYIFKSGNKIKIYVGSSNISYSALISGIEWNYKLEGEENTREIEDILSEFEELYEENSFNLTLDWLRRYEKSYKKYEFIKIFDSELPKRDNYLVAEDNQKIEIEPRNFQIPALYELSKTREEGYKKAMVIVGTGLGKTYLSVFDSLSFKKILFVAHRDEMLRDARKGYENVYGSKKTYGYFNSDEKDTESDIIFASVSTLGKEKYLTKEYFTKNHFDYIVVDEFHHSDAPTYRKVIDYFEPKFLLGLTATPDRNDNGDIYELCDYNIAYECDFRVGINNGWLSPFEYFGIHDDVDYKDIPWRSGRYDLEALENKLIVNKRLELILEKYLKYRKKSTLGFCASRKHCQVMYEYFINNGINAAMIIGETPINQRQKIIEDFKSGRLDIIFTVDVFNEGVDLPCVDTILFLRPTESYTIFIQQLGRGLRLYEGKDKLRVLDFVGNYEGAELKPGFLMGRTRKDGRISPVSKEFELPSGCTADFNFKLIEYFEQEKNKFSRLEEKIKEDFKNVKNIVGKTPCIMDIYTYGEIPVHSYLKTFKSWYKFLEVVNELTEEQRKYSELGRDFLKFLEKTPMTKSYKIPLFLSIFNGKKENVSKNEVGEYFRDFYNNEVHGRDLNNKKHDDWKSWDLSKFIKLAEENPIKFLTEKGKNLEYFKYEDEEFILSKELVKELKNNKQLKEDILNILKYRNSNYFNRKYTV